MSEKSLDKEINICLKNISNLYHTKLNFLKNTNNINGSFFQRIEMNNEKIINQLFDLKNKYDDEIFYNFISKEYKFYFDEFRKNLNLFEYENLVYFMIPNIYYKLSFYIHDSIEVNYES